MSWLRRRLAAEEGISLVEVLVAMLVLTIVPSGLAASLLASLKAIAGNERQVPGQRAGQRGRGEHAGAAVKHARLLHVAGLAAAR